MEKMTPQALMCEITKAYRDALTPVKPSEGIFRRRLRSTSGVQEDLLAYFIRSQADDLEVHIDQPISFRLASESSDGKPGRKKVFYPDIVVVRRHKLDQADGTEGTIIALIDVKTDLGWNRHDAAFEEVCEKLGQIRKGLLECRHLPADNSPGATTSGRGAAERGALQNFDSTKLRCADDLSCHIVVVTAMNSGDIGEESSSRRVTAKKAKVELHVLSDAHPNDTRRTGEKRYSLDHQDLGRLQHAAIRKADFERLVARVLKR